MSRPGTIDYGRLPRRSWARRLAWYAAIVLVVVATAVGGLSLMVWLAFREMAEVNVEVVNESSVPVEAVVLAAATQAYTVTDVTAGGRRSGRWHLPATLGPATLTVRTPRGESWQNAGYLLDDDGPYTFRVTVRDDGVTIWRDNNEAPVTWTMPAATRPAQ